MLRIRCSNPQDKRRALMVLGCLSTARSRNQDEADTGYVQCPIIVVGFTTGLILTEGALRLTQRPGPAIGWAWGRPGEKNEFGFRGHHVDTRARVRLVLLGDSQVEAAGTDFQDMPEVHLRPALQKVTAKRQRRIDWGQGWGQDQELLALQAHIDAIHPSAVVLWFTEGNDLWNNTFPTHFPRTGIRSRRSGSRARSLRGRTSHGSELSSAGALHRAGDPSRQGLPNYPTDGDWERHLPPPYHAAIRRRDLSLVQALADRHGIRVDQVPYLRRKFRDREDALQRVPRSREPSPQIRGRADARAAAPNPDVCVKRMAPSSTS